LGVLCAYRSVSLAKTVWSKIVWLVALGSCVVYLRLSKCSWIIMYGTSEGESARGHPGLLSKLYFSTVLLEDATYNVGALLEAVSDGLDVDLAECRQRVEGMFKEIQAAVQRRSQEYAGSASAVAGRGFVAQTPELVFLGDFLQSRAPLGATDAIVGSSLSASGKGVASAPGVEGLSDAAAGAPVDPELGPEGWSLDRVRQWAVLVAGVPEAEVSKVGVDGAQLLELSAEELVFELRGEGLSEEWVRRISGAVAARSWCVTREVSGAHSCFGAVERVLWWLLPHAVAVTVRFMFLVLHCCLSWCIHAGCEKELEAGLGWVLGQGGHAV
jgi:hypothetical protein